MTIHTIVTTTGSPAALGLMGGTFDPIHLGHLLIANAALEQLPLDAVLFLPDGDPPHKEPHTPGADRLRMVELALQGEPRFHVSDMELRRAGTTYTVDTLLALKQQAPGISLTYLVGSDTFLLFPTWRTADRVATLCDMAIVMRPGDDADHIRARQAAFQAAYGLNSTLLRGIGLDLSSSMVRSAVREGKPIHNLVPAGVAGYIARHNLYQQSIGG